MRRVGQWAQRLLTPGKTLSQRAVQSGMWVFGLRAVTRVARFTRTIVLARLLAPEDFGLMGLALLAVSTLRTFTQTGFLSALVQEDEGFAEDLDTVWTASVFRGLVLSTALLLAAPHLSRFFDAPAATPVIRVVAISVLLRDLENVGVIVFQRELRFGRYFVLEVTGVLVDLVVSIVSAVLLGSVWALVLGLLVERLVRVVVSYLIHPYRPGLDFDLSRASRLFSYGKWLSLSYVLIFVGSRGDDAVVGKVLGTTALGLYQLAYKLSQLAVTETTYVIEKAAFPAYARLQGQADRLRSAYFRIVSISVALSMPAALSIMVLGGDFVRIFLGDRWLPMIPAVRLLAVAALAKSIASTGSPLFKGAGRPRFEFNMQLARAVTVVVVVLPLSTGRGLSGAGLAVVLSALSMLVAWCVRTRELLEPGIKDWIGAFGPPVVASAVLVGSVYLFGHVSRPLVPDALGAQIGWFLAIASVGVASYAATFFVAQPRISDRRILDEIARALRS
jgi:O-antigen/teichoic acid export membrane protein